MAWIIGKLKEDFTQGDFFRSVNLNRITGTINRIMGNVDSTDEIYTVKKAEQDGSGNNIINTYATQTTVNNIVNGNTTVTKAKQDANGNTITSTYAKIISSSSTPSVSNYKTGDIWVNGANIYILDGNKSWQLVNSWQ